MTREEFISEYMPEDNLEYFDLPQARLNFEKNLDELLKERMRIAYTQGAIDAFNPIFDEWYDIFINKQP